MTLESIGDGVITTDAGGVVVYLNPVAEELTGWKSVDALGLPLNEVFCAIDERVGHETAYPLRVCLREGRSLRHESRHSLLRRDGRHFSIQDSAAPIRDRDGRIIGAVVVFHDTTELQHLTSRMAFLASHDSLTGLLNRHEFELRLQHAMETARQEGLRHAVRALRAAGVAFTGHLYAYEEHGGAAVSARELGVGELAVVKSLVMENERREPLIVLMHGDMQVSNQRLARELGMKYIVPCSPEAATRHTGYLVGGTSPFGTRKQIPVCMEASILDLPCIYINGGKRGYLVGVEPQAVARLLQARLV